MIKMLTKYFSSGAKLVKKVKEFFNQHHQYFDQYYQDNINNLLSRNKNKNLLPNQLISFSGGCASDAITTFNSEVDQILNDIGGHTKYLDLKEELLDDFQGYLMFFINEEFANKLGIANYLKGYDPEFYEISKTDKDLDNTINVVEAMIPGMNYVFSKLLKQKI